MMIDANFSGKRHPREANFIIEKPFAGIDSIYFGMINLKCHIDT